MKQIKSHVTHSKGCPKIVSRAEWGARPPSSPPTSIGNNASSIYIFISLKHHFFSSSE